MSAYTELVSEADGLVGQLLSQATDYHSDCQRCGELMTNIAARPTVKLKCPNCAREPVTIAAINGEPV